MCALHSDSQKHEKFEENKKKKLGILISKSFALALAVTLQFILKLLRASEGLKADGTALHIHFLVTAEDVTDNVEEVGIGSTPLSNASRMIESIRGSTE
jgi:hypothetical protein